MEILNVDRPAQVVDPIRVTMYAGLDIPDDDIIALALHAAGESYTSLFGWRVHRWDDTPHVLVTLNRD